MYTVVCTIASMIAMLRRRARPSRHHWFPCCDAAENRYDYAEISDTNDGDCEPMTPVADSHVASQFPETKDERQSWMRVSQIGLVTVAIAISIFMFVAISFLMPYLQESRIVREVDANNGNVRSSYRGPSWLPAFVRVLPIFRRVTGVSYSRVVGAEVREGTVRSPQLRELERLQYLEGLNLQNNTQIDDAELEFLSRRPFLKSLVLSHTSITDAGLKSLGLQTSLTTLDLSNCNITDAGMSHLASLKNMIMLLLNDVPIGDDGLSHLQGMSSLQFAFLDNTQVTDAGLEKLYGLPGLRTVSVRNTHVTNEGMEAFRKAMPGCHIQR